MKTSLVSIVIPVYNEALSLVACLEAIAEQTVTPLEVIVVDNNSTDASRSVAESFPFVRLLSETKQGVVHARSRGFNAARGTIIGRIDADTIIDPDWVENVEKIFADPAVDAVSGSVSYYDVSAPKLAERFDIFFRQRLANRLGDEVFLYGANMAIRRSVWRRVRMSLCQAGGLHEDFDLAIHAEELGANVTFNRELRANVSLRRFESGLREFWHYACLSPRTYARHGRTSQRYMYPIITIVMLTYWFIWLNHQVYNPETGTLSLRRVFGVTPEVRVNPATFVD